ncbi:MAG: hypothetical protein OXB86_04815 [Bdellovibrionales bacterium]|nr:hypothetical protein [Bdellovibrionales bacterium]
MKASLSTYLTETKKVNPRVFVVPAYPKDFREAFIEAAETLAIWTFQKQAPIVKVELHDRLFSLHLMSDDCASGDRRMIIINTAFFIFYLLLVKNMIAVIHFFATRQKNK